MTRENIAENLKVGDCYFHLGYYDRNLSIPFVDTYFFIGKNLFSEVDYDSWFFQSPPQFLEGRVANTLDNCEEAGIFVVPVDGLEDFVDWNGLISELSENNRLQGQGKCLSQVVP